MVGRREIKSDCPVFSPLNRERAVAVSVCSVHGTLCV